MAEYKRWFPVSHDINSDPEVIALTDRFGLAGAISSRLAVDSRASISLRCSRKRYAAGVINPIVSSTRITRWRGLPWARAVRVAAVTLKPPRHSLTYVSPGNEEQHEAGRFVCCR